MANILHGGNGMYMDRFVTAGYPGMLILHGNGNVFERVLGPAHRPEDLAPWLGADLTGAEVRYLMEREWAQNEDDVLWRRTKLGLRVLPDERKQLARFMTGMVGIGVGEG